jgi:hypothetical protein
MGFTAIRDQLTVVIIRKYRKPPNAHRHEPILAASSAWHIAPTPEAILLGANQFHACKLRELDSLERSTRSAHHLRFDAIGRPDIGTPERVDAVAGSNVELRIITDPTGTLTDTEPFSVSECVPLAEFNDNQITGNRDRTFHHLSSFQEQN